MNKTYANASFRIMSVIYAFLDNSELELVVTDRDCYKTIAGVAGAMDIPLGIMREDIEYIIRNNYGILVVEFSDEKIQEEYEDFADHMDILPSSFLTKLKNGSLDNSGMLISFHYDSPDILDSNFVVNSEERSLMAEFYRNNYVDPEAISSDTEKKLGIKNTFLYIKNGNVTLTDENKRVLKKVVDAIRGKVCLRLQYKNSKGNEIIFYIKPLEIIHYPNDDLVYIITKVNDEIYNLRIDRVCGIKIIKESLADIRKEYAGTGNVIISDSDIDEDNSHKDEIVKEFTTKLLKMFGPQEPDQTEYHVILKIYDEVGVPGRIKRDLGRRAEGSLDEGTKDERKKFRQEEDYYIYEDKIIGMNSFRQWVRSYGSSVVVIEPRELGLQLIEEAKKNIERYNDK